MTASFSLWPTCERGRLLPAELLRATLPAAVARGGAAYEAAVAREPRVSCTWKKCGKNGEKWGKVMNFDFWWYCRIMFDEGVLQGLVPVMSWKGMALAASWGERGIGFAQCLLCCFSSWDSGYQNPFGKKRVSKGSTISYSQDLMDDDQCRCGCRFMWIMMAPRVNELKSMLSWRFGGSEQ